MRRRHIESEYARCVTALNRAGILIPLPRSKSRGVLGIDGKEYPLPSLNHVFRLFASNRALVSRKTQQGFNRLELTPLAVPTSVLIDRMKEAIIKHAAEGKMYRTRRSQSSPLVPVRVNAEKHVWVWETLRQALDTDKLVYLPKEYSSDHRGMTKSEAMHDRRICAFPGWSIGLAESFLIMPTRGRGKTVGGRKQLEIGHSPREYLQILKGDEYQGETGKTLEDFITEFLVHLMTTGEVSNDVYDSNALWCLAQYMKIPYAEVVPTGRWHRSVGRVRLDMHRTGNKLCAKKWGGSSVVRLVG